MAAQRSPLCSSRYDTARLRRPRASWPSTTVGLIPSRSAISFDERPSSSRWTSTRVLQRRKVLERRLQAGERLAIGRFAHRDVAADRHLAGVLAAERVGSVVADLATPLASTPLVDAGVPRDLLQPGADVHWLRAAPQRAHRAEEDVLDHVLRGRVVVQHPHRVGVHARPVPLEQRLERALVAAGGERHQGAVRRRVLGGGPRRERGMYGGGGHGDEPRRARRLARTSWTPIIDANRSGVTGNSAGGWLQRRPTTSPLRSGDDVPMARLGDITTALDQLLAPERYRDYGPNGLQVAASRRRRRRDPTVATAVSADGEALDAAAELGADLVLVHHGLFWDGDPRALDRVAAGRLRTVLAGGMALVGLPPAPRRTPRAREQPAALRGTRSGRARRGPGRAPRRSARSPGSTRRSPPTSCARGSSRSPVSRPIAFPYGPDPISRLAVVSGAAASMLPSRRRRRPRRAADRGAARADPRARPRVRDSRDLRGTPRHRAARACRRWAVARRAIRRRPPVRRDTQPDLASRARRPSRPDTGSARLRRGVR